MLFGPMMRDYTRFDESADHGTDNPWLQWGRHLAHDLAERRGWHRKTRETVDQGLHILLSDHDAGDVVHYTAMFAGLRARGIPSERIADVLGEMNILIDDRRPSFDHWLTTKLADLAPGIAEEAALWIQCLHDGGPRTQPRNPATAQKYANAVRPVLLDWSTHHDHLREITRDDILAVLKQHHGAARQLLLIALRSLFRHCKKNRIVFQNPTARIRVGARIGKLAQPLADEQIQQAAARASRPADRLIIALAAIHAARSQGIRELRLDDVDLGNRRLTIAGRSRPLDDLTYQLLTEWLDYRRTRWPMTVNPHLIINQQTAAKSTPVSRFWIGVTCRRLDATVDRLHADRHLEEALTHGPDPLHLAVVFGLDRKTAIRYADSARQLLRTAIEDHTPESGPTQGMNPPIS
ncbi:hypothetical protein [Nocardia brasiliensis]|uniref:hypothetical protein n=1 Tax=Nocardia brasiliensis TaxID=37326 RepID=UPI0018947CF0|nr:hypothetical protein [Nocardia brasiliensis]MBF6130666.1 hypothetical protein [Nocardia brasiliensis]